MKKKLPTHDDTPSVPLEPKVIETEAPNYEGDVRGTKYEIDEDRPKAQPLTAPTSKSVERDYPISDDEVDKYAVDTRIWDRMAELLDGSGGDAGPHTHSNYADKATLEEHLANHPSGGDGGPHTHNEYSLTTHGHNDLATKEELTVGLGGKANTTHDHPHNHSGLYSPTTHLHNDNYADKTAFEDHLANHPSGGGGSGDTLKIMTQAEYDALENPDPSTLYVVI